MYNKAQPQKERIRTLAALGVFCAIAYICVFLFPIHVEFLTFDIKDSVITIAGMVYGPLSALAVTCVVSLIEFLTISSTGVYGLIMNILASAAFSLTASLIYRYRRTFGGAIAGLFSAVVAVTAVMAAANLIVTPYYLGLEIAQVKAMLPTLLLPFNATKGALNAGIVLLLYKHLSRILRPARKGSGNAEHTSRTLPATVIALAVIAVSLIVFFFVLGARF